MPVPRFTLEDDAAFETKVLISGAGLGGLMLGALLERAGIDFAIYEQADRYIRIGSAMALTANVLPLFDQIGILPMVLEKSKPVEKVECYNEKLKLFLPLQYHHTEKFAGYLTRVIPHPDLYDILYSQVPEHKILWGKKIIRIQEDHDGVSIGCTDGTSYRGQVVVGADGAHSGVRESMYKGLSEKGELPRADKEDVSFNGVCLLGETKVLKADKFPLLRQSSSIIQTMYGEKLPYYWAIVPTHRNTICWLIIHFFDRGLLQSAETITRWKSQPAGDMCEALKDLPLPCGENLTLQDLMEETSRELLSKIMHEERFFQTWYSGRAVLMGDACHKMTPCAGLGAVNALQDAAVLANYLDALPLTRPWTQQDITDAFRGFKDERYPHAKQACDHSRALDQLMGKHWLTGISRTIAGRLPEWFWKMMLRRIIAHRPLASFLPPIELRGTVRPSPQPSLSLKLARTSTNTTVNTATTSNTRATSNTDATEIRV
ncbi:unnamed protein product [Mortierella alpina]